MNAAAAVKDKSNLITVTPCDPPPDGPEFDTTTPVDVSVLPFSMLDLPKWGAWLLYRMSEHWPHMNRMNYAGIVSQYSSSNGFMFIRAKRAILLASSSREPLDPRPVVDIVFCFKHHRDDKDENKDARLLYRRVDEWARGQGARYVRVLHQEHVDTNYTVTKEIMGSDDNRVLIRDLDA